MRKNAGKGEPFIKFLNGRVVVFIWGPYEITAQLCETKNRNSLSDLLKDVQRHHRMNLQNSILGSLFLRLD